MRMLSVFLVAAFFIAPQADARDDIDVRCPPIYSIGGGGLEHLDVLAGAPGQELTEYPAWLAPDDTEVSKGLARQTWSVDVTWASPTTLVCRYHGTNESIRIPLPEGHRICISVFPFTDGKMRAATGSPVTAICH